MMRNFWPIGAMLGGIAVIAAAVLSICTLSGRPPTTDQAAALLKATTEAAVWHSIILPAAGIK
jgi:hypothetical protein